MISLLILIGLFCAYCIYISRRYGSMRFRGLSVTRRGGRLVATVENIQTGERHKVIRRLGRWRHYQTDQPITDKSMVRAARKVLVARADEERAQLSVKPAKRDVARVV